MEAAEGAAGGAAAEEEVPLEQVEDRGAAEEEGAPSGSPEEVEGPEGRLEQEWTGCPLSSASSERGSVKEDGDSGSGQEKVESSLSLKSIAWSTGTHHAGYHGNTPAYYRSTLGVSINIAKAKVLTVFSDIQVKL